MVENIVERVYNYTHPLIIGGMIMDRITESFLQDFSKCSGFTALDPTEQFAYFADYCAIANEAGAVELNLLDMHTGVSTQGIDGIAIEVNGKYVTSIEEIEELQKNNKTLTE